MSSPSNPVNIRVPRPAIGGAIDGISASYTTPIGTPDLRALRANYVGTPPRNIPPRTSAATPARDASPLLPAADTATPVHKKIAFGGISAQRADGPVHDTETPPPLDLDDLPEEDKAKVLRRHLVSKEERQKGLSTPDRPSRSPSASGHRVPREDTEPFPVPYDAPGADIT